MHFARLELPTSVSHRAMGVQVMMDGDDDDDDDEGDDDDVAAAVGDEDGDDNSNQRNGKSNTGGRVESVGLRKPFKQVSGIKFADERFSELLSPRPLRKKGVPATVRASIITHVVVPYP